MSLVENLARRQHRAIDLLHDIEGLKRRGYNDTTIARKTGLTIEYVKAVLRLLKNGEHRLLRAVEAGQMPVSIAVEIAGATDAETQNVLQQAYEKKLLRGHKLIAAKRLIEQRQRRGKGLRINVSPNGKRRERPLSSNSLIRRAPDQIQKLFVRKLEVFPPQGTSIRDSFFAIQRPTSAEYPGRRYLGISAFGRRYPVAMIRSYVAHMAAAQVLYDKYDRLADPWMTLTGYFNSIRELAGTRRLVDDDIRTRLRDADQRGLAKRRVRALEELTSRKSGTDIPKILERLEATFDKTLESQRTADRKAGQKPSSAVPYDVVLATNMISVGVDIERLGLMLVAGQPKNTSEYIQATSRVGRSSDGPGLVTTVFNWARPRDLSHYERFEHYHETFYKHVEALSVTPFSARALDRGLSGVMVALARLWDDHLNANMKAGEVLDADPVWARLFDILSKRGGNATHDPAVARAALLAATWRRRRPNGRHAALYSRT